MKTQVLICEDSGLCYGAKRAVDNALECQKIYGNVTIFKQLLHNNYTIQNLISKGIKQKDSLALLNSDDFVILRAHGEPPQTYQYFQERGIKFLDCTCPNVLKINKLVKEKDEQGYKIIIVGKHGLNDGQMHPEVYATSKWCKEPYIIEDQQEIKNINFQENKFFLVIQTTFSNEKADKIIQALEKLFLTNGKIFEYVDTTCKAKNRIIDSSIKLAQKVDCMIVVGGKNSSNTLHLYQSLKKYIDTYQIEDKEDLYQLFCANKLKKGKKIGLTGGASTTKEELVGIKQEILKMI